MKKWNLAPAGSTVIPDGSMLPLAWAHRIGRSPRLILLPKISHPFPPGVSWSYKEWGCPAPTFSGYYGGRFLSPFYTGPSPALFLWGTGRVPVRTLLHLEELYISFPSHHQRATGVQTPAVDTQTHRHPVQHAQGLEGGCAEAAVCLIPLLFNTSYPPLKPPLLMCTARGTVAVRWDLAATGLTCWPLGGKFAKLPLCKGRANR